MVSGKITHNGVVRIKVKIDSDMPLEVFKDMQAAILSATWEYIDERKKLDDYWQELTPFN